MAVDRQDAATAFGARSAGLRHRRRSPLPLVQITTTLSNGSSSIHWLPIRYKFGSALRPPSDVRATCSPARHRRCGKSQSSSCSRCIPRLLHLATGTTIKSFSILDANQSSLSASIFCVRCASEKTALDTSKSTTQHHLMHSSNMMLYNHP